ncbi:riboflavin synthase subunit alpha [Paraferrimonas sp. SM1919]|uniref:riboflavin synthase subunit alpha n=1 Tax=Paraferrimonas sp. SM1919 TaxID=2662263 RepID=UPI0013D51335|nr:riboflavin synthase subunit alpha [Paraferrimonas sp. SM1919]
MFTGIVAGMAKVEKIIKKQDFQTHVLKMQPQWLQGLEEGASVAHNGCCLTVTQIDGDLVSFDVIKQTLAVTNLASLQPGDWVNIERAARFGDEIGGHSMSGHIFCLGTVTQVIDTDNNRKVWIDLPEAARKYALLRGYIGIDGCSLTISDTSASGFCVDLIPETLTRTLMGKVQIGNKLNIEVDPQTQAIVDTVERVLASRAQ